MNRALPLTQRLHDRRTIAGWWGVLALLLQILVPIGQAVPAGATVDGLPRTLVICSVLAGARTVPLPGSATPMPADTAGTTCAVCLAQGIGGACDLPPAVAWTFPPSGSGAVFDHSLISLAHGVPPGLPQARAPPMTV